MLDLSTTVVAICYLLSPATFLTNTCMVDSGSADDEREETGESEEREEMELERMLVISSRCDMV